MAVALFRKQSFHQLQQRPVVDPFARLQKRPVGCPYAGVQGECVDQGTNIAVDIGIGIRLTGEFFITGELHECASGARETEQRLESGLIETCLRGGTPAVVDQYSSARPFEHRCQRHQLILLDLNLHEQAESGEFRQQLDAVGVISHAVHRGVEGDTHDAGGLEPFEHRSLDVVRHDGDSLESSAASRYGVEQAAVIGGVSRIRTDHQRVPHSIGVKHMQKIRRTADLLSRWPVRGVRCVWEPHRIDHMIVTVDLGFVIDVHNVAATRASS